MLSHLGQCESPFHLGEEQEHRIAPQEGAKPRIAPRGGAEALRRPQPLGPETQCLYKTEAN